jgi:sigma-B regulation protein RsbU (phosphoserine phosphatase)
MGTTTDFFDPATRHARGRLAVSVELMRELSRYSDPEELSRVFARRLNQLYPTSRQLTVSRRGLDAPRYRVTRYNLWPEPIDRGREPEKLPVLSGGLIGELVYDDQPRVIDDLDLPPGDPAGRFLGGQRSLLAIPLFDMGTASSMLLVARQDAAAFPREQVPDLVWLSNLFAHATQTLKLSDQLRDEVDKADYELRTVGELQQSLLPPSVPAVPGLDVAAHSRAAHRAGGDYHDFFPLPDGKFGALVADVSGHGTAAAVLMAITHGLAHARTDPPVRPGEMLAYLNYHLAKKYTLTTGNFVTAVYAVVDPVARTLTFSNAGHAPPRARLGGRAGFAALDQGRKLPLGVTHRTVGHYPEFTVPFLPGDEVALFTDGMTDAANSLGEPFGVGRLDDALAAPTGDARAAVAAAVAAVDRFAGPRANDDDQTLVLLRRLDGSRGRVGRRRAVAAV